MENSDNEGIEDIEDRAPLAEEDLAVAAQTHVRGIRNEDAGPELPETERATTTLHDLAKQMFQISTSIWRQQEAPGSDPTAQAQHEKVQGFGVVSDHAAAKQAARESRRRQDADLQAPGLIGREPEVEARPLVTSGMLRDWLSSHDIQAGTNVQQREFLRLIVDRVLRELNLITVAESQRQSSEPLVYLLHGPPGTGKSFVLPHLRQLFQLLGYKPGIEFEITAFQAVNAASIEGKTIHNAFGMNLVGATASEAPVSSETAKRMAYWRWVIVDEISMVNARLLAHVDQRLRAIVPTANAFKHDRLGQVRPFAGVNMIFIGDFYQLPPPEGGYLADVPARFQDPATLPHHIPDPLVNYGRELFWSGAVQGVVELTERMRCQDAWWNDVVDELRAGHLSEKNHRYLHGLPVEGCNLELAERASRCRVIHGQHDPRLQEPKFKNAVVIVANNDARYQINKDRAVRYSLVATGEQPRYAAAMDKASTAALQAEMCDKDTKIRRAVQFFHGIPFQF